MEKVLMVRAYSTHGERKLLFDRFVERETSVYMFMNMAVKVRAEGGLPYVYVTMVVFCDRMRCLPGCYPKI